MDLDADSKCGDAAHLSVMGLELIQGEYAGGLIVLTRTSHAEPSSLPSVPTPMLAMASLFFVDTATGINGSPTCIGRRGPYIQAKGGCRLSTRLRQQQWSRSRTVRPAHLSSFTVTRPNHGLGQAKPKPAAIGGLGSACDFRKPKPRLWAQAGPAQHYQPGVDVSFTTCASAPCPPKGFILDVF
jgi:hypothetical protein